MRSKLLDKFDKDILGKRFPLLNKLRTNLPLYSVSTIWFSSFSLEEDKLNYYIDFFSNYLEEYNLYIKICYVEAISEQKDQNRYQFIFYIMDNDNCNNAAIFREAYDEDKDYYPCRKDIQYTHKIIKTLSTRSFTGQSLNNYFD